MSVGWFVGLSTELHKNHRTNFHVILIKDESQSKIEPEEVLVRIQINGRVQEMFFFFNMAFFHISVKTVGP